MGRQKSQIEEVAREIAHVSSALQDLYATLGEYAPVFSLIVKA